MSGAAAGTAVSDAEADALLAPLERLPLALAVSGGPDSMALMLLVARRLEREAAGGEDARAGVPRPRAMVLTVDHGLRAASAEEARLVARQSARLGLDHRTIAWTGPKPAAGIAEAARAARYRLLDEHLELEASRGPKRILVTAHHADDQVETFLMRLARGSGVQGLAAMRATTTVPPSAPGGTGLTIARPLLGLTKARLVATVEAAGIPFVRDPTNVDARFERPRVRAAAAALAAAGVSAEALGLGARRLARADAALETATRDAVDRDVTWSGDGPVASIRTRAFAALPEEVSIRLLSAVIARIADGTPPPRLSELERLDGQLRAAVISHGRCAATLGGAMLSIADRRAGEPTVIEVRREPTRRSR